MTITQLAWRRVEQPKGPPTYFNDSHGFAIFPEVGGHGWELCQQLDADSGYDFLEWYDTVSGARAGADWRVRRDERRVSGA